MTWLILLCVLGVAAAVASAGLLNSSSESSQKTLNNQQTVSDQGIALRLQGGSALEKNDNDIKLGKGATLTVNQGLGAEEFNAGLAALAQGLSANVLSNPRGQEDEAGFKEALNLALANRAEAGTEKAVDEIKSGSPSTAKSWITYAVVGVVLFALVLVFLRKK